MSVHSNLSSGTLKECFTLVVVDTATILSPDRANVSAGSWTVSK
jgi:hypothetical protein